MAGRAPTMGVTPADSLPPQDGAHLRAFHPYSGFFGGLLQGIQAPLR